MEILQKILDLFDPLSTFSKCGLAGLAIGVLFLLFKDVIRKSIFPKLTRKQLFQVIMTFIFCSTIVCIVGIVYSREQKSDRLNSNENLKDSLKYEPLILKKQGVTLIDSTKKK